MLSEEVCTCVFCTIPTEQIIFTFKINQHLKWYHLLKPRFESGIFHIILASVFVSCFFFMKWKSNSELQFLYYSEILSKIVWFAQNVIKSVVNLIDLHCSIFSIIFISITAIIKTITLEKMYLNGFHW